MSTVKAFYIHGLSSFVMGEGGFKKQKKTLWRRLHLWWYGKEEAEQKRLKSFIPLTLYTIAVIYGVIYLSISIRLTEVREWMRSKPGTVVIDRR